MLEEGRWRCGIERLQRIQCNAYTAHQTQDVQEGKLNGRGLPETLPVLRKKDEKKTKLLPVHPCVHI